MWNKENKIFFDNARFHEDSGYKVLVTKSQQEILAVKTGHGVVYYKVEGDKITDCVRLSEVM